MVRSDFDVVLAISLQVKFIILNYVVIIVQCDSYSLLCTQNLV